jgi:hypothetical protein
VHSHCCHCNPFHRDSKCELTFARRSLCPRI